MAKSSLTVFEYNQNGSIRVTNDGRFSVYDVFLATGVVKKRGNTSETFKRIASQHPKVLTICDTFKFPGQGQQDTPVADEEGVYQILMVSPGKKADEFREWAAKVLKKERITRTNTGEPYWYKRLKQFNEETNIPDGYFCIFKETLDIVGQLEAKGYTLPDTITPDISIGKHWVNYLRRQGINPDDISVKYSYRYPNQKYPVSPRAYDEDYLPQFRKWFRSEYKPVKLPKYLIGKDQGCLPALSKVLGVPLNVLTGKQNLCRKGGVASSITFNQSSKEKNEQKIIRQNGSPNINR